MKKHLLLGGAAALLSLTLITCQDSYEWSPTYAVPLASGSLSVADVIGARPSDVETVDDTNDLVSYELNYRTELDPIPAASFGLNQTFTIPEKNVFLRMFGNTDNGSFHFTNPQVEFTFRNTVNAEYDVNFVNLYTENVNTGEKFPFNLDVGPPDLQIPAKVNDSVPGVGILVLNNDNTSSNQGDSALTTVFSPTPKFLKYTTEITPTSGGIDSGTLTPIANVKLPLEGYGRVTRIEQLNYSFKDSLFSVGGDDELFEASAGLGDFGLLRLTFINGIPLEVTISGKIYSDSTNIGPSTFIANLPFYDEADNPLATAMVVQGAEQQSTFNSPTTNVVRATTEVRIERESSAAGLADLSDFEDGQAIVLELEFNTTGEPGKETIKIFDDQTLDFSMGVRINGEAQFRRPKLRDLINGDDED